MQKYDSLLKLVNQTIDTLNFDKEPKNLYQPIDYTLSLGGKRLRPVLTLMACDMLNGDVAKAILPSIGIEIFHNFTLLHDDIMDNAPIRRGKASVFRKWNNNIAILSGDTMFALAYQQVSQVDPSVLPEILEVFSKTAIEICEGQQLDMDFEERNDVTIPEYMEMIRLKTAVLLATSLKTGAIIAGASQKTKDNLYTCGLNLGMAFQLMDDYLDTFADQEKFGKEIGGDIKEGKKTFLYLKALEIASPEQKEKLFKLYNTFAEDAAEKYRGVVALFEDIGIKSIMQQDVVEYSEKALQILSGIEIEENRKSLIRKVILQLTSRKL
jgi:geranylgeranyl diphosphate synthase, type II